MSTFSNFDGDVMLTDTSNGGTDTQHWVTWNRYDQYANVLLAAQPSAMTAASDGSRYDASLPDLIDYDDGTSDYLNDTGLINVNTYYASTTATMGTPGGVTGWADQTAVAQGEGQAGMPVGNSGGPVLQTSTNYVAAYDPQSGITSYFTSQSVQYPEADEPRATTNAYQFNTGDAMPSGSAPCTLSAWVRCTPQSCWGGVLSYGGGAGSINGDGRTLFLVSDGDFWVGTANNQINSGIDCEDDQWHLIIATFDGSTWATYVGTGSTLVAGASGTLLTNTVLAGDQPGATIGCQAPGDGSTGLYYTGDAAQLAIWDHALSGAEMAALVTEGRSAAYAPGDGLLGYWPLTSDTDDHSGNGIPSTSGGVTISSGHGVFNGSDSIAFDDCAVAPAAGAHAPAIESETTALPAVPTAEGGTGSSPTSTDVYNSLGQLVWSQDANGSISYTAYDPATGAVNEQIQDVNFGSTYNVGNTQFDNDLGLLPESWGLPTTGKNLVTTYVVDSQGRTIEEIDPDGDVTCTVYNDAVQIVPGTTTEIRNQVRTYPGWNPVTDTTADAIQVSDTVDTDSGSYGETLGYTWSGALPATGSMPTGGEDFSTSSAALQSLSRSLTNNLGQAYEQDDYSDLTGVTYSATSVYLPHADYDPTTNQYDIVGNLTGTVDPDGDITHTVYDFLGNATSTWTGTDDGCVNPGNGASDGWLPTNNGGGSNMAEASSDVYDNGGVGDGNLTSTTIYPGNSAPNRTTAYGYDWQDQQTYVVDPADAAGVTYTMTTYDNLGEATETQQYLYGGAETNGIPAGLAADTAEPPSVLNTGDALLSQSVSTPNADGETYQTTTTDLVNGTPQTQSSRTWYDANGNETATVDPDGNGTVWTYNHLGQVTQSVQGQTVAGTSSWPFTSLMPASLTSALRTYEVYVCLTAAPSSGWQGGYSVTDSQGCSLTLLPANSNTPATGGWYDLGSVTLASSDTSTSVTLTVSGGKSSANEACLGYSDSDIYDPTTGLLQESIDRDGRATTYQYNVFGQETGESWYSSVDSSGNPVGSATETITYGYNADGLLQSATDQVGANSANAATDSYTYDADGDVLTDTQTIPGLTPTVVLDEQYTDGNRTQLSATIGGTSDFVNNYQYDGPTGQMSQVTQSGVTSGNAVAAKTVGFTYDNAGEFSTITRYQNAQEVAKSTYGYDPDGNLTSLVYSNPGNGATPLPSYAWSYDSLGNMAASSETLGTIVDSVSYTNDSTGQLLAATGTGPSESYSYDPNGNRETANGSTDLTGPNNELLSDGTYNYTYDGEGNCILRTCITDGSKTAYTWDNRDRLTSVTQYASGAVTQTVTYTRYDAFDRWVGETITPASGQATQTRFIYDGNQIVLQFDGNSSSILSAGQVEGTPLAAGSLSHRYLWGPAVDQLLADEQLQGTARVVWALTDNENTVVDLATSSGGVTTVVNHREFSAYGQLLSQTNPTTPPSAAAVDCLFAYTGRPMSVFSENSTTGAVTGLQNNGRRWYDGVTGRWLSQDPSGLASGDGNLYRYCGNAPTDGTDADRVGGAWQLLGGILTALWRPDGLGNPKQVTAPSTPTTPPANPPPGMEWRQDGGAKRSVWRLVPTRESPGRPQLPRHGTPQTRQATLSREECAIRCSQRENQTVRIPGTSRGEAAQFVTMDLTGARQLISISVMTMALVIPMRMTGIGRSPRARKEDPDGQLGQTRWPWWVALLGER